jgi:Trk K+ transport system NAD-binding subunit
MAALYSSDSEELMKDRFAAFHISGGTTELLIVKGSETGFDAELVGGTKDLNAGQIIDRIGVFLGMPFPAGPHLERAALEYSGKIPSKKVSVEGTYANLSGLENMAHKLYEDTGDTAKVAAFVFEYLGNAIVKMCEGLIEKYDVSGVVGNGACLDIQTEANVKDADLAIVLTNSDELNVFACLVAKKIGVKNTIARVRNPDYRKQILDMKDELGISMIVNPEQDTATEIFNLINLPSIDQIEHFGKGKVLLVEIVAEKGCAMVGETLVSLGKKLTTKVLICAVQRGQQVIIPTGHFIIEEGDRIHLTSDAKSLRDFLAEINLIKSPLKNIMIVGGSKIGYYLADELSKKKYKIKLIEHDKEHAEELGLSKAE